MLPKSSEDDISLVVYTDLLSLLHRFAGNILKGSLVLDIVRLH